MADPKKHIDPDAEANAALDEIEAALSEPDEPIQAQGAEPDVSTSDLPSFDTPTSGAPAPKPDISRAESFAQGAGQTASLGLNDEIAGGLLNLLRPSAREGIPATYAGQDAIDSIRQDQSQAAEAHPSANFAGRVAGAVPAAIATGGGSLPATAEAGAAQLLAQKAGEGTGGVGNRIAQVGQDIAEHPATFGAAVAAPAVMKGLSEGIGASAQNALQQGADRLMTQTFMTPAQRAAFVGSKGRAQVDTALADLGKDAREAGMFKPRAWYQHFLPTTAARVRDNAAEILPTAGREVGRLEEEAIRQTGDAPVAVKPLVSELEANAPKPGIIDPEAPVDAAKYKNWADYILQRQQTPVKGYHVVPPSVPEWAQSPKPPITPKQAPAQAELPFPYEPFKPGSVNAEQPPLPFDKGQLALPGMEDPSMTTSSPAPGQFQMAGIEGRQLPKSAPTDQLGFDMAEQQSLRFPFQPRALEGQQADLGLPSPRSGPQYSATPLEATGTLERDQIPLSDAIASKKYIGDKIDWTKANRNTDYGTESARRVVYHNLNKQIDQTLQNEAAMGRMDPSLLNEYTKAKKQFGTAAQVFEPALKMAERQGDAGLNLKDLAFGAAVGSPLATIASRTGRGMGASGAAGLLSLGAGAAGLADKTAKATAPLSKAGLPQAVATAAQNNPNADKPQIEQEANSIMKKDIANASQKAKKWWEAFIK